MKRGVPKLLFFTLGILLPFVASAETKGYVPLEPIPGLPTSNLTLPAFLNALFNILLQLGAALAVVMLAIGGFQYMTSEVLHGKEKGRERIQNAVLGLLLLLGTYLILYTVNPNLLNFNLIVKPVGSAAPLQTAAAPAPAPNPTTYNSAVSGAAAGRPVDPNTQVTYTNPDGTVVGIDKNSPSCRRLVNNITALGRTVQGQCN